MSLITEAYLGKLVEVQKLLESENDPIDVNEADAYGDTALHAAAYSGRILTVEDLVRRKANVNAKNHVGSTPLHKAVLGNNIAVINFLLENGADPEVKNVAQKRAEFYVQGNNTDLIQTLKGKSLVTKNLTVPRDRHGQLIGKAGKNLNTIRMGSGAEIKVPKEEEKTDEVVLRGRDDEVKEAERLITEFLAKEPPPSARNNQRGEIPDNWPRTKLNINKENLRFVIGPKGRTIRAIQEKTGARIHIPRDDEEDTGVQVAGPYEALEEAVKMIYAAIVDNSRGGNRDGNRRDNNNNNNNRSNNNNNRGNNNNNRGNNENRGNNRGSNKGNDKN